MWWKRANQAGGVSAFLVGTLIYVALLFVPDLPKRSGILIALPASAMAMYLFSLIGQNERAAMIDEVAALHADNPPQPGAENSH